MYKIVVDGNPVPKGRPRFYRGCVYTPKRTSVAERRIADCWRARYAKVKPVECNIMVRLTFNMKTRRRVDLDNLAKTVLDALNGVAYADDCQIVRLSCHKKYPTGADNYEPHTIIEIEEVTGTSKEENSWKKIAF